MKQRNDCLLRRVVCTCVMSHAQYRHTAKVSSMSSSESEQDFEEESNASSEQLYCSSSSVDRSNKLSQHAPRVRNQTGAICVTSLARESHVQLRHYFKQYVCCHHRLQALMFLEAFLQRGVFSAANFFFF